MERKLFIYRFIFILIESVNCFYFFESRNTSYPKSVTSYSKSKRHFIFQIPRELLAITTSESSLTREFAISKKKQKGEDVRFIAPGRFKEEDRCRRYTEQYVYFKNEIMSGSEKPAEINWIDSDWDYKK
jgi:hypothetical protein